MKGKLLTPKIGVAACILTGLLIAALAQPGSRLTPGTAEAARQSVQLIRHPADPKPPPSNPPATGSSGPPVQAGQPAPPRAAQLVVASTQQRLINQDRANVGLPPLTWNSCLAAIAMQNAVRMAAQGYISHANGVTLDLGCRLGGRGERLRIHCGRVRLDCAALSLTNPSGPRGPTRTGVDLMRWKG